MRKSNYIRLILLFTAFNWFTVFSRSALLPYFIKEGLTFQQIIFGALLTFIGALLVLLFVGFLRRKLNSKASWYVAIILSLIYLILLIRIASPYQLYLAYFINGLTVFFFYIFYNTAYFEATAKEHIGKSSALMFSIGSLISLVAPLLAGCLAEINYLYIWIPSLFFFLIPMYVVKIQQNFAMEYSIREIFNEIKATRIFIFYGAFWEAMVFGVIPIYTLFFIKTPLGYGTFLAYLGLVGILANLLLGALTDKIQKRILFLYPVTLLMSIFTFLFVFAVSNIFIWVFLSGAVQLLYPIYNNLALAMIIDTRPDIKKAITGREMMLSIGRIAGLTLAFLSFTLEKQPFYIFFVLGSAMLLYPINLLWRTRLTKSHVYL
jgi:MFS family permease